MMVCPICRPCPCNCDDATKRIVAEHSRYRETLLKIAEMPTGDTLDSALFVQQMAFEAVYPPAEG